MIVANLLYIISPGPPSRSLSPLASLTQPPAAHEEDRGKGRQRKEKNRGGNGERNKNEGSVSRSACRMWGGRSHNAPIKGESNGEGRPELAARAGAGDERSLTPALDDDSMPQDGEERGGQRVTLSPLPPPRPWKVPGGGSDAQPAARKGAAAAAADSDRWRAAGDDRREGGVMGKDPLSGGVAQSQSGPSQERRDPRSFSPRVESVTAAPYGVDNDRGVDGPGDDYNSGGGGNVNDDGRSRTSASAALRRAGVGTEARGEDARTQAGGGADEQRGGGKAAVATDGSGRPANIIRIRIPPPSGQQAKATGRPLEANRFSNDKDKDLGPARSSGNTSSHPAPSGMLGISTAFSLGGGRTSPSSGGGDRGFDGIGDGIGDGGGDGGGNGGGNGGGPGGSSGGDTVAEGFVREDGSFGEVVSMFPGKTGRKKKNPVPTRAGGRNRTP